MRIPGVVHNPAKPGWCRGLTEKLSPTPACRPRPDGGSGPPDGNWSYLSNPGQVIFARNASSSISPPSANSKLQNGCRNRDKAPRGRLISSGLIRSVKTNSRFSGARRQRVRRHGHRRDIRGARVLWPHHGRHCLHCRDRLAPHFPGSG
jgi:hypothetical protein